MAKEFIVQTGPGKYIPEIDPITRKPTGYAKLFVAAPGCEKQVEAMLRRVNPDA